ncbi:pectinesterase family protein [Paludibacter sp.]|uniref:pectinesterase family protein n=1 Tax=Paludibacter sp. TaxID=1898105 RepID=UPI00135333F4|nr:pectinesterase family protein [Paludibacter sp.]MTK51829.1 pectin esterase [Paludibacter sp.]
MRRIFILFLITMSGITAWAQKYDFVVAKDGSGNFTTIQAAVDASKAFPDSPITIFIKNGVYNEKVKVPACNPHLRLIGESAEKTILTYGDHFDKINRGRNSTFYTYTLLVEADDFHAENMTIENSAGPVGQAVALHVEGDRCAFVNCRLLGNQDTLYLAGQTSRDYFGNCYIEGTTDFIFGAATAYFEKCTLHSKTNSYVTAASTNQGKKYGFVFNECKLTAAEGVNKAYLGRPWRDYARVVYIHCAIGKHIAPAGWVNWDKTTRDKTAYYAEFENNGEGASTSQRVAWSHQLTKKEAANYTKEKVLAAALPSPEPGVGEWAK